MLLDFGDFMMNCLIAGAGPGGLVAALALKREGFAVRVLERAGQFRPLGGGLGIQSNGLRVLERLGLLKELRPHLRLCQKGAMTLWGNRLLSAFDFSKLDMPFPYFAVVLRHELHEFLVRALAREGIAIEMGKELVGAKTLSLTPEPLVEIEIKDPQGTTTRETTQLLIGAEGVHSPIRKSLVAAGRLKCGEIHHQEPWLRLVTPRKAVTNGNSGERAAEIDGPVEIWGDDGRRFGIVPLTDRIDANGRSFPRTYCFLPVGKRPWQEVLNGGIDEWKASWTSYGEEVMALLNAVENWREVSHSAFHEVECDRWSDPPIFLLGDAVHGMTPNLGQGANCAMTDGLVLAHLLGKYPHRLDLAASEYHRLRFAFVGKIQKTARMLGQLGSLQSAPLRWARNAAIRISDLFPSLVQNQGRLFGGYNPLEKDLY